MNQPDTDDLAAFEYEADLRFKNRAGDLYEEAIEKTKDLVEQYSNAGIAEGGKFSRQAANVILARFKFLGTLFQEAYIRPLERRPEGITEPRERWVRAKLEQVVTEQVRRAQVVMEQCCAGFGQFAQVSVHVVRLQGEGGVMMQRLGNEITLAVLGRNKQDVLPEASAELTSRTEAPTSGSRLLIFISHSSRDAALAEALIDLLKSAIGLVANQIRCSSVDGYRLPVGVNTENKLREEVNAAKVAIGLITPSSLSSYFVMFELGARWGANLYLAPLLAGVKTADLSGPLSLLNALSAQNESQLHQLLEDVAAQLALPLQGAASYVRHITRVKELADTIAAGTPQEPAIDPKPRSAARLSFTVEGTPPSQIIRVVATRAIGVWRLEYMMSDEACIVGEDLSLEGRTIDVPLNHDALTKLWNTPRPDMNQYDHSGPAKLALVVSDNGGYRRLILPIRMEDIMLGNTMYRKAIGSKAFYGD